MKAFGGLLLLAATGCGAEFGHARLWVGGRALEVEVADRTSLRRRGLRGRASLPADRGMLFVYPEDDVRRFWMKDVPFPLDVAFLGADGTVLGFAALEPHDETWVSSEVRCRHALEVPRGLLAERGVAVGDRIEGLPALSPP